MNARGLLAAVAALCDVAGGLAAQDAPAALCKVG